MFSILYIVLVIFVVVGGVLLDFVIMKELRIREFKGFLEIKLNLVVEGSIFGGVSFFSYVGNVEYLVNIIMGIFGLILRFFIVRFLVFFRTFFRVFFREFFFV